MTNSWGNCSQHYIIIPCIVYKLTLSNALKSKSQCWRTEKYYVLKWKKAIVCGCVFEAHIATHLLVEQCLHENKKKQATDTKARMHKP